MKIGSIPAAGLALAVIMTGAAKAQDRTASHPVVSTWALKSHQQETVETGEKFFPRGQNPSGLLTYTADGRFSIINVPGDRKPPAAILVTDAEALELFRGLTSYAGRYTLDGDKVTHHVEISWNQLWTGTDQVRTFKVDGDTLTIVAGPALNPRDGKKAISTLLWDRVKGIPVP